MESKDAFEGISELEDLRSEDSTNINRATDTDDSDDAQDEFQRAADQSSEDDDVFEVDDNPSDVDSDPNEGPQRMNLDETVSTKDDLTTRLVKRRRKRRPNQEAGPMPVSAGTLYVRGVSDRIEQKTSQANHRLLHFGASSNDLAAIEAAKRKWLYDAKLPSRISDANGFRGMHTSFFITEEACATDARSQRKWWFDSGGLDVFRDAQAFTDIDGNSALAFMPETQETQAEALPFRMGPFGTQTHFELRAGHHCSIRNAWQPRPPGSRDATQLPKDYKRGFVLNLGAKVNCLDWAPNQNGPNQYLAASVLTEQQPSIVSFEAPEAPAFTPQPPRKSNIQVWKFRKSTEGYVDTDSTPELGLVLCTNWGDVRVLKWCPMPYASNKQTDGHLGLLAGVWSDGAIRVLSISLSQDHSRPRFIHIKQAPFESKPPGTICTCVSWISSTRIAAGCANGCIAVWDVAHAVHPTSSNPRPIIYSSVSSTYILSILTCYPSHPNLIVTASMAGIISMTDLSRSGQSLVSQVNTVSGTRIRMGHPLLVWNDFGQIAIHADDTSTIKGSTLRRFFAKLVLAKAKSNATSIASSPCHPFILVGCANGEVFSTNPLNKVTDSGRSETWQQAWFAHEWRRPETQAGVGNTASTIAISLQATTSAGTDRAVIGSNGISRFIEGLKAEFVPLAGDGHNQNHNRHYGTAFTTVYEENSAITAVAWNPNLHVGGWAAAGMGDGLLRVEDIAI
jgi:transcription factor C subunit 6